MSGISYLVQWAIGLKKAFTGTTVAERTTLYKHVGGKRAVMEIGVYHGVNTREFGNRMAKDGQLFAVDPFFKGRFGFNPFKPIARAELKNVPVDVIWVEKVGPEAAPIITKQSKRPTDFIFFDGDHSWEGIESDWLAWGPILKPGCIVAFHDSIESPNQAADAHTGSVRYLKEVILPDPHMKLLETTDSLAVFERV